MYVYQLVVTFYTDFYAQQDIMDTNGLIYLAPFFILILSIVYLVRIKVFDRLYGIELSELNEREISVFSSLSEKDQNEIKNFQEGGDGIFKHNNPSEPIVEDYYRKL